MGQAPEKDFENKLYNYLKENQGKAFTVGALRKKFETFNIDPQIREYCSKNLLTILKNMRDNEKIKLIPHDGKTHYFIPEIYDSTQYESNKTHFIVPENFISAEPERKKIKKKYCKNCKKEVISEYRRPLIKRGKYYFFFTTYLYFTLRNRFSKEGIEARQNTGWFCPDCNERLAVLYKKVKIIAYLSCAILTCFLMTSTFFTRGELQTSLFVLAIFFFVITILITIWQVIRWILKKSGRKVFKKMKNQPKEYFDDYVGR